MTRVFTRKYTTTLEMDSYPEVIAAMEQMIRESVVRAVFEEMSVRIREDAVTWERFTDTVRPDPEFYEEFEPFDIIVYYARVELED